MPKIILLQSLPPAESLNPQIALWIIGTLLLVIVSGVLFAKWMFNEAKKGIEIGWMNVKAIHKEGIDQLKAMNETQENIKMSQIRMEMNQKNITDQVKETRYSQSTMAKLATEVKVRPGGLEEIAELEEGMKRRKELREAKERV